VQDLQGDVAIETAIGLFVTALVPRQLDVDAGSVARVLLHPVRRPVGARNDGRRGGRRQRSKRNSVSGAFALTDLRGRHHSTARKGRLEEVLHLPVNLVDVSLVLIIIIVAVVVVFVVALMVVVVPMVPRKVFESFATKGVARAVAASEKLLPLVAVAVAVVVAVGSIGRIGRRTEKWKGKR